MTSNFVLLSLNITLNNKKFTRKYTGRTKTDPCHLDQEEAYVPYMTVIGQLC